MLSTAQSYRPGTASEQHHISPGHARRAGDRVHDAPEERTAVGHAVARRRRLLDRQRQPAARRAARRPLDQPVRARRSPTRAAARLRSATLTYTHAYFPQEKFDEVVQAGRLDVRAQGQRLRRAVVVATRCTGAPTPTRASSRTASREPFDLVADGGADNVWFTQVGDATQFGDFARVPRRGARGTIPQVTPRPANGPRRRLRRERTSRRPRAHVTFGTTGPLTVKGAGVPLDHGKRYDNPWALANFGAPSITIADADGSLTLDFVRGTRVATVTDHRPGHHRHP